MNQYMPPLKDLKFALDLAGLQEITTLPGYEDATSDVIDAVLEEAGRFASEVVSPLNRSGDEEGARWDAGRAKMPAGWKAAYATFVESGWNSLAAPRELGGQNLPRMVAAAVEEMLNGASVAFALLPMLSRGAVQAIQAAGSDQLKRTFLPKMVSGEWTGTMVLTEPQAGSDLSAVRTMAEPQPDGTYRLSGTKIFITYGDHDLADNVVHLVLARVRGAPSGSKGISLFVVPRALVNADGSLGEPNDVKCVSLERKLGLHATPTCVLAFGDRGGAVGYLVGQENRGLEHMFIMMNSARFAVGLEGIGLGERAYQQAVAYARERLQGAEVGGDSPAKVPIIRHPDVRRMLLSMKSRIEAMRALAAVVAAAMDKAALHPDEGVRASNQSFVDVMMPVVKAWFTENGLEIASLGIQVHGGTGFIEETGAAQHLRDARITTIYEGTTGIQAMDLVGRKIGKDGGQAIRVVAAEMMAVADELRSDGHTEVKAIGLALTVACRALSRSITFLADAYAAQPKQVLAGSVPFLHLLGVVAGGWQMGRAALAARKLLGSKEADQQFLAAKIATARFYADHELSRADGLAHAICNGHSAVLGISEASF